MKFIFSFSIVTSTTSSAVVGNSVRKSALLRSLFPNSLLRSSVLYPIIHGLFFQKYPVTLILSPFFTEMGLVIACLLVEVLELLSIILTYVPNTESERRLSPI